MASPHTLDFDVLLAPIPGADPAGVPLPEEIRRKLDELRREPDEFEKAGGAPDKKADWYGVILQAEETLTSSSKDLLVAVRLLEGLAKKDGFAGLHQGMSLLSRLVAECWDRLHPKGEAGDMSDRLGPFLSMNHAIKALKFPATVANLPFFERDDVKYGQSWVSEASRPAQREEFERIFESLKVSDLQQFKETAEHVRGAHEALKKLGAELDKHFSTDAPDLLSSENPDNLGRVMNGCVETVNRLLKKSGLEGSDTGAGSTEAGAEANGAPGEGGGDINAKRASRESLYRQIGNIADVLSQLEPHSPIPFLLKRVVRLGALPFPDLMREMVRDSNTLDEFDRLLGIKKEESS